jgi:hypothetical protein
MERYLRALHTLASRGKRNSKTALQHDVKQSGVDVINGVRTSAELQVQQAQENGNEQVLRSFTNQSHAVSNRVTPSSACNNT